MNNFLLSCKTRSEGPEAASGERCHFPVTSDAPVDNDTGLFPRRHLPLTDPQAAAWQLITPFG
ncbi:hypothetical protein EKL29_21895 [Pantoea sp. YU22]|uniref:Uncharacterized protein n=1 Tax=Pantoea piersonii TaxID=2364647 RepID=A0AAJ5QMD9_9GAMM|nr:MULTISPECIES: hypothetical protein [Pantoea]RTY53092.1 hypothetical protein EKL29_21895 [Pantoea sp. YU22]WBG92896.1 hypothetical protein N5580_19890 [Pantoea piersonii]WBV23594.1 hypothetical protein PG877_20410 [Pantoea piersonii]